MSVVEMAIFSMMYDYGMMWRCVLLCFIDPNVLKEDLKRGFQLPVFTLFICKAQN